MIPADSFQPEQLVGKQVAFKADADHQGCWHARVGLTGGVVVRAGQSLAQKAELLEAEGLSMPAAVSEEDVPRVWVKADPCRAFPRGCETAVEVECLLVVG